MSTSLVYCNKDTLVSIPEAMGCPKNDQFLGTPLEKLAELCGRVCYDSLGEGRSSEEYHKHILEVRHLSVYEHCVMTININRDRFEAAKFRLNMFLNRPGVWVWADPVFIRLTINARAILEWTQMTTLEKNGSVFFGEYLDAMLHVMMPQVQTIEGIIPVWMRFTPPIHSQEIWYSYWIKGSRGFSHEMVRHGDWTAISQRSTRYVDESQSKYCWHPLIKEYMDENPDSEELLETIQHNDRIAYNHWFAVINNWLIAKGVDKFTARKQARGAARGVLANALETQMIFSASKAQWNRIVKQRVNPAADREINDIMSEI